ncbi:MAG: ArdC-like ssDNA-binding domain-containing protein [Solirubrobacteraceae bacterium]
MAKYRRPVSDEEREQRRAEQRELVRLSIEQLRSSDGWQSYLRARAHFRCYSPRNVLMILCQHPTAIRVAGFRAWLDLGWCPVKGSKAIRIWAPCPPSGKQLHAWRDAGADPDKRPRTGWRLASVFAQDQVSELPPPATPAPLEAPIAEIRGDSHEALISRLVDLAEEIDYTVQISDTGPADGSCNAKTRTLKLSERLQPNGQLVALIHELAHALVAVDPDAPTLDYAQGELIAESIAFCCAETIELDSSANSIPYLAGWAESASLDVLEQTAQLTSRLASRIEGALLADPSGPQPADQQLIDPPQSVAVS